MYASPTPIKASAAARIVLPNSGESGINPQPRKASSPIAVTSIGPKSDSHAPVANWSRPSSETPGVTSPRACPCLHSRSLSGSARFRKGSGTFAQGLGAGGPSANARAPAFARSEPQNMRRDQRDGWGSDDAVLISTFNSTEKRANCRTPRTLLLCMIGRLPHRFRWQRSRLFSAMSFAWEFAISNGDRSGQSVPLPPGEFVIGRASDCDLSLVAGLVSRHQ